MSIIENKQPTELELAKRNIIAVLPTLKLTLNEHNQLIKDFNLISETLDMVEKLSDKIKDLEITIEGLNKELETLKA